MQRSGQCAVRAYQNRALTEIADLRATLKTHRLFCLYSMVCANDGGKVSVRPTHNWLARRLDGGSNTTSE